MSPKIIQKPAYALATILVLLGVCLFGVGALVTVGSLESKISRSQSEGVTAYYVAEAGVADAMWRLNNTPAILTALRNGTLNTTYTVSDKPSTGQGYTVTMVTTALGARYGEITVEATSNNGDFTSKRKIVTNIFAGPSGANIGTSAIFGGYNTTISASTARTMTVVGDIFSNNNTPFTRITANITGAIYAVKNITTSSSTLNASGGLHDLAHPAAPAPMAAPGFDFVGNRTNVISPTAFINLLRSASTVNIPGPITFVDGNVTMTQNLLRNRTINLTGMLIINGNLLVPSNVGSSSFFNIIDPGNGKAGIFVSGNLAISGATWNVQGVVYASGNNTITAPPGLTINGALIAGGNVTLDPGPNCSLTFNANRVTESFYCGDVNGPNGVVVQHWEEEY